MMRNPSSNSSTQLRLPPNNSMQLLPLLNLLCPTMMTCFHPSTSRSRERRLPPLHQHRNKQLLPLRLRNHVLPLNKQLVPLPPNNSMQLLPLLNLLCPTMMTCFHPSTSRSRERRLPPLHQHRNKQLLPLRLRNRVL